MAKSTVEFWTQRAAELRAEAALLPDGPERDLRISQAEQLDAAIVMQHALAVPTARTRSQ